MKIYIAADHAGFDLKTALIDFLHDEGHEVIDKGAYAKDPTDDYPDVVASVCKAVQDEPESMGLVIGSSGQGEAMAANRFRGIRAALYYGHREPLQNHSKVGIPKEPLQISREDNNSNVLSLGATFVDVPTAELAVKTWLETAFSEESRHMRRIAKLDAFE